MSQDQITALKAQAASLREQLAAIEQAERELVRVEAERVASEERAALLSTPITITVTEVAGSNLITQSIYRPDLVALWAEIPGRSFKGYTYGYPQLGKNSVPIREWENTEARILTLPFTSIEWAPGVRADYEWYVSAPEWAVSLADGGMVMIRPGPGTDRWSINGCIRGMNWNYENKVFYLPLLDAWRVYEMLEKFTQVIYTDDARKLIVDQLTQRSKLDLIALKTDSDFITSLNGHAFRGFQSVGVEYMDAANGNIILGDDTGLGKSWQALGFASIISERKPGAQTLIITKPGLITNIRREIEKLLPEASTFVCRTGSPHTYDTVKILVEKPDFVIISYNILGSYHLLDENGTTHHKRAKNRDDLKYTNVYPWVNILNIAKFELVIIDEAHMIKNRDTHRNKAVRSLTRAPHIIPVTATPIINRIKEFYPLLNLVAPHVFNNEEHFMRQYATLDGRPANTAQFHELVRPYFLRRKKSEVMKDLPPINRIPRFHDLSEDAGARYQLALKGIWEEMSVFNASNIDGRQMSIVNQLSLIQRLLQISAADKITTTVDLAESLVEESETTAKVLIVSRFLGVARAIADKLGTSAVCTVERSHSDSFYSYTPQQRDDLFESVKDNPEVRFIVTTEASREGLNMTYCDWIIFNDQFWSHGAHAQMEGRAYGRLDNPHPVDAYYVVTDTDIEQWLSELLQEKLKDFESAVDGIEQSRDLFADVSFSVLMDKIKASMWS